jgi:hypothetical protein
MRQTDGPRPHLPCPSNVLVAVGNRVVGPTPQMSLCGFAGGKKRLDSDRRIRRRPGER